MNRNFIFLIGVLLRLTTAQAQSVVASNTMNYAARPVTTEAVPHKTKATESPFYIKAYGFYGLLTPGTLDNNYNVSQTQATSPNSFNAVSTKLGAGLRAGGGIGFIVSDFINVGLDADVLFGTPVKVNYDFYSGSNNVYNHYTASSTTTLNVLSIIPNVTFKALSRPTYYIYNRLSLVGGIVLDYKTTGNQLETPAKGAITTSVYTSTYTKNSLALGYQAALGIQFRLSQAIRAFAEVVAYNQSFKPREEQSINSSTTSGKTTTSNSTALYKDQGDYIISNPPERPSYNVAINSVGVGAGLVLRF